MLPYATEIENRNDETKAEETDEIENVRSSCSCDYMTHTNKLMIKKQTQHKNLMKMLRVNADVTIQYKQTHEGIKQRCNSKMWLKFFKTKTRTI